MIDTTSFKLRPNEHLDFFNPKVADLRDICHMAWVSVLDIDHDIWPWILSLISAIDPDTK